ncbi:MAG: hypothetical protein MUF80_03450, partial [Burkholderiales bacterium]|nr:hypothetical protein [Burkholderiales bacterium]
MPTFMRHPGSFKPSSIANKQPEIQIVDTHESLENRVSIGFAPRRHQINRTLLFRYMQEARVAWVRSLVERLPREQAPVVVAASCN